MSVIRVPTLAEQRHARRLTHAFIRHALRIPIRFQRGTGNTNAILNSTTPIIRVAKDYRAILLTGVPIFSDLVAGVFTYTAHFTIPLLRTFTNNGWVTQIEMYNAFYLRCILLSVYDAVSAKDANLFETLIEELGIPPYS